MEKIGYKKEKLEKPWQAFNRSLELYQQKHEHPSQAESEAYTASLIKHFELLYEMIWKFLKFYLLTEYGTDVTGSRTIFRACLQHKLITQDDLNILLNMVDSRNDSAHIYDEKTAHKICQTIIEYVPTLHNIITFAIKKV